MQDFRHAQYSLQFSCSLRHEEEARRQSGRLEVVVNCDCTYNYDNFISEYTKLFPITSYFQVRIAHVLGMYLLFPESYMVISE